MWTPGVYQDAKLTGVYYHLLAFQKLELCGFDLLCETPPPPPDSKLLINRTHCCRIIYHWVDLSLKRGRPVSVTGRVVSHLSRVVPNPHKYQFPPALAVTVHNTVTGI